MTQMKAIPTIMGIFAVAVLFITLSFSGCSSAGGGGGATSGAASNAGAAMAALLASSDQGGLRALITQKAQAFGEDEEDLGDEDIGEDEEDLGDGEDVGDDEEDTEGDSDDDSDVAEGAGERDTCMTDANGDIDGPQEFTIEAEGEAGTYGDGENTITLEDGDEDWCSGEEDTDAYAYVSLQSDESMTCGDEEFTITAIAGVYRNTDTCFPEFYGEMTISDSNSDTTTMDCYLCLNEDQTVSSDSSCSENGTAISLDDEASCQLNAGGDNGGEEDEEDTEGDSDDEEELGDEDIGEDEEDV